MGNKRTQIKHLSDLDNVFIFFYIIDIHYNLLFSRAKDLYSRMLL